MDAAAFQQHVNVARLLARSGARKQAVQLLHTHLQYLDPDHTPPSPVLLDAVTLYTELTNHAAWRRYLHRHTTLGAATGTDAVSGTDAGPGGWRCPPVPRPALGSRAWSVDLDTAMTWHQHGHCGEAVRHATAALRRWTTANGRGERGQVLLIGVVAMLSACLRDTDARTILGTHHRIIPAVGTPARERFVADLLRVMDETARSHQTVCLARLFPDIPGPAPVGDDGLAWQYRRARWWQHAHTLGQAPR